MTILTERETTLYLEQMKTALKNIQIRSTRQMSFDTLQYAEAILHIAMQAVVAGRYIGKQYGTDQPLFNTAYKDLETLLPKVLEPFLKDPHTLSQELFSKDKKLGK